MILPDFVLLTRSNRVWTESGMDSTENCANLDHFNSYKLEVVYNYNSRGFRDSEWPTDPAELKKSIWCVGDSFTVGIGSNVDCTWPKILQKSINVRTINVSMDGASNTWIARKCVRILEEIAPEILIIHWSYLHRVESDNTSLIDEQRAIWCNEDHTIDEQFKNLISNLTKVNLANKSTKIIHSIIPEGLPALILPEKLIRNSWSAIRSTNWPIDYPTTLTEFEILDETIKSDIRKNHSYFVDYLSLGYIDELNNFMKDEKFIGQIKQLDYARDSHHYDKLTATSLVNSILHYLY